MIVDAQVPKCLTDRVMPQHVIVDGSNLATEGRTAPSLKQLNEAIASYRNDHPDVLMTVVVDATFGHRIDPKEVAAFEEAIDSNEFVAPPAGAVGRGDGFILNIAQKANASILSNDSYQEFHGEFAWLFDEGRLIGGKPVPHVGWVWVNRVPVRGPVSRRSVKEGKTVDKQPGRRRGQKANDAVVIGSASANAPMPIPTAPPPGAVLPTSKAARDESKQRGRGTGRGDRTAGDGARAERPKGEVTKPGTTNDLLPFLSFVEHFPVGTAVTGVVESYSSHGAYVAIGDVHGYVPLRLMADPPPRSAREAMDLGETVTLVVSSFGAARRSVDLAVPSMAPAVAAPPAKAKRGAKAAPSPQLQVIAEALAASPEAPPHPVDTVVAAIGEAASKPVAPRPAKGSRAKTAKQAAPAAEAASAKKARPNKAAKNAARKAEVAAAAKESPAPEGAKAAKASKAAKPKSAAAGRSEQHAESDTDVSAAARSRRQPRASQARPQPPDAPHEAAPQPPMEQTPDTSPAKKPVKKKGGPTKRAAPRRRPTAPSAADAS